MLKAKSTPYMPTYYHQRTHHKQRKPHAISGGGGPDLSASGSPFFFPLLACIFSLFHWGNKSESNNISTRKAKKHAQIYREFSLQRQSKFWGGGGGGETLTHQETPPPPPPDRIRARIGSGRRRRRRQDRSCAAPVECEGGGGRIGGFLERRGEGERIPRDSLLSSPLLVSSSLPRVGVGVCGPLLLGACASLSTWAYYAIE